MVVREVFRCLLSFALGLALALIVKKYAFPNDHTRSMKVNTAVEFLVQETFLLCSAMHSSVTLLLLLSENWSSRQLNTSAIPACFYLLAIVLLLPSLELD